MMAILDLAMIRTARSIIFLLLLTFTSNVLASDSQISSFTGYRPHRSPPIFKAQDLVERKLAAVSPESVVSGDTAPAPSPSTPRPSPPPSNKRPALTTPSGNAPGADLPPEDLPTPPPSGSQVYAPVASTTSPPSLTSKQSNTAVVLGVTLGVVVVLVVSVSAAAYLRPELLPCCKGRNSRLTQYERHLPT